MALNSLSSLQLHIIHLCDDHDRRERLKFYYSRSIIFEKYFIKYNDHENMYAEYAMQRYILGFAEGDAGAPRIPKIYEYFAADGMGYLVMEYIQHSATRPRDVPEKVASALKWLRDVPPPSDAAIGAVAGRDAPYMLFKGFEAPIAFSSTEAIERYMNRALDLSRKGFRPEDISFKDEKVVFAQSDIHEGNFFLDTEEKMCLIDFGGVALLPESFAGFSLVLSQTYLGKEVADRLNWSTHNFRSMSKAIVLIQTTADKTLRLDEDGFPKPWKY